MKKSDIKISDRQREEMENDEYPIHELASSIRRTKGPVQKIVVDNNNNLIAGERRLNAINLLSMAYPQEGWDELTNFVDVRGNISEEQRFEMELEENLHRKSLTPREYHDALLKFHQVKSKNNPDTIRGPADPAKPRWTKEDTAKSIGKSKSQTSFDIRTAEILALLPEEKKNEIYKKAGKSKDLVDREVAQMMNKANKQLAAKERKKEDDKLPSNSDKREEVKHIEALQGLKEMETDSVDLIITDPPYGTLEGSAGGKGLGYAVGTKHNFDDNENKVYDLLKNTIPEMYRVLRPGSHIYMFCGLAYNRKTNFYSIANIMDKAGFTVRSIPLIWFKPVQGYKPPFTHWPLNHEAIIFASTGKRDRENAVPRSDVLEVKPISGNNKDHRFQKPIPRINQLINVSIEADGKFLDPFCGGGAHLLAARRAWMSVQGFDSDLDAVYTARDKLDAWDLEVLESNGAEEGMKMLQRVKKW